MVSLFSEESGERWDKIGRKGVIEKGSIESRDREKKAGRNDKLTGMAGAKKETTV